MTARIPLRNRAGDVIAEATVDDQDADLAKYRWHLSSNLPGGRGYAVRTTSRRDGPQRVVALHTTILERMGHPPGSYPMGDHINRDPLDNRRRNLRAVTGKINAQNRDQRAYGGIPGRPRVLSDHPPRDCEECGETFTPRRKAAAAKARFCSRLCQRRWQSRENAPTAAAARWGK